MKHKALKQSIYIGQPGKRGCCRAITCINPAQRMRGSSQLHSEVLRLPCKPRLDSYELADSLSGGLPEGV